jgi:phosphohistidine phosphatase
MDLYILRHGIAVDHGAPGYPKDSDRPLTPKGERKLWQAAEAMEALDLSFDLILSSPYARARQTAELTASAFNAARKLEFSDTLIPSGKVKDLITVINDRKPLPDSVLLVGHEPHLSELISLLVCGNAAPVLLMKKGGLCKLTCESLKPARCATLEWLLTPKQMALMR